MMDKCLPFSFIKVHFRRKNCSVKYSNQNFNREVNSSKSILIIKSKYVFDIKKKSTESDHYV